MNYWQSSILSSVSDSNDASVFFVMSWKSTAEDVTTQQVLFYPMGALN